MRRCAWVCLLLMSGCFGGKGDLPKIGQVDGVVTMDGTPLPKARIIFEPEKGRPSFGYTDEAGKYHLGYLKDMSGAVVGHHVVRISTSDQVEDPATGKRVTYPETVPAKYNKTSTLTAEVAEGKNDVPFALTSK